MNEHEDRGRYIPIVNMSHFFNRELLMYSLGDIKFKKPIALKKVAYTTLFILAWTLPLILIFGLRLNVYFMVIAVVPPFILGHYASKPVWGGKSLLEYVQTIIGYIGEPPAWADLKHSAKREKEKYSVEAEIWISRRRELQLLADMREKRLEEQEGMKIRKRK